MENLHRYYLEKMGITRWVPKEITPQESHVASPICIQGISQTMNWSTLEQRVAACMACGLEKTRTQTVFGIGNKQADLLFVGEAPGAQEDRLGEPFVGRAGQLLDAMLRAMGLSRQQVYIANILKCRPPSNRDPSPAEVAQCTPFLEQQVKLIAPQLIVALGRIAAHYLLKTNTSLMRLRGRCFRFSDTEIPLIVTYHPAYLLRSPQDKRKAFQDLQLIMKTVSGEKGSPSL